LTHPRRIRALALTPYIRDEQNTAPDKKDHTHFDVHTGSPFKNNGPSSIISFQQRKQQQQQQQQ
jgi:hypothetical protein